MTEFWFDTQAGKMIAGEAAYEEAVTQSFPGDIVPLPELLLAPDFPYQPRDFVERRTKQLWSREEKLALGHWALKLLEDGAGEPRMLKSEPHIERLHILGLSPSARAFNEFGPFSAFRESVGSPIENRGEYGIYANWSIKDFVDYARELEKQIGDKPEQGDFERAGGPTHGMIYSRVGGVRKLNEYLGYPNIQEWDKDDFIAWGTKVIAANGAERLTTALVRVLSRRRHGPGDRTIIRHFTRWSHFKQQAIDTYGYEAEDAACMQQHKLDRYKQMLELGTLPSEYGELEESELLRRAGRYLVVRDCIPTLAKHTRNRLASSSGPIIPLLRSLQPQLSAGQIEMVAVSQGVFDDLWPIDPGLENLKVTDSELAAENAKQAVINKRSNANRRAWLKNSDRS